MEGVTNTSGAAIKTVGAAHHYRFVGIEFAVAPGVATNYGVVALGQTDDIHERFFAISAERRLTHPAVVAVSEAARNGLFEKGPGRGQAG